MGRIFSNSPATGFLIKPFTDLVTSASHISIAAPYVTTTDELVDAARRGSRVDLLVGLNAITTPAALAAVFDEPNIRVRYYAHHRFHAKIYLFDTAAMLGSSNLTDGGLKSNREATILLDQTDNPDAIVELRAVFNDLWEFAAVLTDDVLQRFTDARRNNGSTTADDVVAGRVGIVEPPNINVHSQRRTAERIFLESLRCQVMEYRSAFNEVADVLQENEIRREELDAVGPAHQANRFLSWVRRKYAPGDVWESTPPRSQPERRDAIISLGREWMVPGNDHMHEDYLPSIRLLEATFTDADTVAGASKHELMQGLLALHAFFEQFRFVKGGAPNLPIEFWNVNHEDAEKVRKTLKYWLHARGDFVERLHDILYDSRMKLGLFGAACALELYGTIKPKEYPPINGRIIKALRYFGFNVQPA
jgi:hypothetical protein